MKICRQWEVLKNVEQGNDIYLCLKNDSEKKMIAVITWNSRGLLEKWGRVCGVRDLN